MKNDCKMLTVKEVSQIFGVDENYVTHTLCKIKGFPYLRIKKRYFFEQNLVMEWIRQNQGSIFN